LYPLAKFSLSFVSRFLILIRRTPTVFLFSPFPPTESPTGYQKSLGLDIQYKRTSGAGLKGENKKTVGVLSGRNHLGIIDFRSLPLRLQLFLFFPFPLPPFPLNFTTSGKDRKSMMPRWFRPLSHPRDIKRVWDWIFNIKEPQGLD
jgi:hypothetical protein